MAPPKHTRVQVAFRSAQIDLVVDKPAESVTDGRDTASKHRRIRDDDNVGGQELLVIADELIEMKAPDFFLAFEKHFDVQRKPAGLLHVGFDGLEVHEDLPLVVGRTASVKLTLSNGRLERRGLPQLDRIDRLHVVVAVKENRRSARRVQPLAVDDGVARCLDDAHVLEADSTHVIRAPLGRPAHVSLMLRKRADAWDREIFLQLDRRIDRAAR